MCGCGRGLETVVEESADGGVRWRDEADEAACSMVSRCMLMHCKQWKCIKILKTGSRSIKQTNSSSSAKNSRQSIQEHGLQSSVKLPVVPSQIPIQSPSSV